MPQLRWLLSWACLKQVPHEGLNDLVLLEIIGLSVYLNVILPSSLSLHTGDISAGVPDQVRGFLLLIKYFLEFGEHKLFKSIADYNTYIVKYTESLWMLPLGM